MKVSVGRLVAEKCWEAAVNLADKPVAVGGVMVILGTVCCDEIVILDGTSIPVRRSADAPIPMKRPMERYLMSARMESGIVNSLFILPSKYHRASQFTRISGIRQIFSKISSWYNDLGKEIPLRSPHWLLIP